MIINILLYNVFVWILRVNIAQFSSDDLFYKDYKICVGKNHIHVHT